VKNTGKIRSEAESYSASEAAALLGVSTPTLKRMVAEGRLESFRTPGGHVRILAESIGAMREPRAERIRPVRDASPVLQNRRERLEELTLEAQEVRARRELEKLQREDEEEAEQQEEEEEAREQEAAERQAELELEREQLEQKQAQERARKEAERALAAFRCRWLQEANQALADPQCRWLSAAQKKEIIDAVEAEIGKRQPSEAPRMATILAHTIAALIERFQAERQAQKRRQQIIERALWSVSVFATEQEKARAAVAVREAVRGLDADASESELLTSAQEAVRPIQQAIERRLIKERVLNWAIQQLPWGKTELDAVRVRRECAEILAELPEDFSEVEAKEALAATVQEACQDIEERHASQQRQDRKKRLIEQGIAEILTYLYELEREGEITSAERLDSDFSQHIRTAVRRGLESELSGDESNKEVRELVREIIDQEM
jgi:excisionase family DNA binding protein